MDTAVEDDKLKRLAEGITRWREKAVGDYWLHVSYMGPAVNRFGDHDLTVVNGQMWHNWKGEWRRIERGSDYWLFSVPGAFAWARDLLTKLIPEQEGGVGTLDLELDDEYGYVKTLGFSAGTRDSNNFTFEVRHFGEGAHPNFEEQAVD